MPPPQAPSDALLENRSMIAFPKRNGRKCFAIVRGSSARQSLGRPPGGRASDPCIAMAGNFFHPTHPRTHIHIRLTLLTQILISFGNNHCHFRFLFVKSVQLCCSNILTKKSNGPKHSARLFPEHIVVCSSPSGQSVVSP